MLAAQLLNGEDRDNFFNEESYAVQFIAHH